MFNEGGNNRFCSPELLSKVADVVDSAILITRFGNTGQFDHKIIYLNPAFAKLTGFSPAELIGRSPDILCDPRTGSEAMLEFYAKCRIGQKFSLNIDSFKKAGNEVKLNIDVTPITDDFQGANFFIMMCKDGASPSNPDKKPLPEETTRDYFSGIFREDIKKDEMLREQYVMDHAEKTPFISASHSTNSYERTYIPKSSRAEIFTDEKIADYCKTQFLANMSHDLRTPLNAIIGFSEVIKDQLFGPIENTRYVSYANDIYRSGQELLATISEIMELSEIRPEEESLEEERINLSDTIEAVLDVVSSKAFEGDVKIIKSLDAKDIRYKGDRRKIKQAIAGVLNNVIKHSSRGSKIEIATSLNEKGDFRFIVYAKSANIASNKGAFGSLLGTVTKKVEGEYPELSLARRFIEAHQGKFNIFNSATSGTEITVTLPSSRVILEPEKKAAILKIIN